MSLAFKSFFPTSPLVFFYRLFWGELILGILYISVNITRQNTVDFTSQYPLLNALLSDTISLVIFISLELIMVILIFLSWYSERYSVLNQEIRFSHFGLRSQPVVLLVDVLSETLSISTLQHWFHSGSIQLTLVNGAVRTLANLAEPEEFLQAVIQQKQSADGLLGLPPSLANASAKTLLRSSENQYVEFKSSLTFDYRLKQANSELPKAVLKNFVAFLNTSGGILLIGVDDKGKILGLQPDFDLLSKPTADAWENGLTMLINKHIGVEFYQYLTVTFETVSKKTIAIIKVNPSPMPAYLNFQGKEEFYIRTGNSSQPLSVAKATKYIQTHFPTSSANGV